MHQVSQALMIPVIVVLLALIVYTLYQVGTVLVEAFSEHKKFDPSVTELINRLEETPAGQVAGTIANSTMLRRQREALLEVWSNRGLPEDAVYALAKRRIGMERGRYDAVIGRTDMVSRIGPMVGLMGTLIPLGPGIVALGGGDTVTLANSLLVAFDTTVAGLLSAAVCVLLSRMRRKWYTSYMQSLEAVMTALLERIDAERKAGDEAVGRGADSADFDYPHTVHPNADGVVHGTDEGDVRRNAGEALAGGDGVPGMASGAAEPGAYAPLRGK